jgi:plasmid stability protein
MKILTVRLPEAIEKKIRIKAKTEHRSISDQIKKYITEAILCENNPDLPLSFILETLEAKEELKAGLAVPYQFGVIK